MSDQETRVPVSPAAMRALYNKADLAGMDAGKAAQPVGMLVGTPKDLMGSLLGKDTGFDPTQPVYAVPEGPCGFAWINVRPGNSRFANWLKRQGIGSTDSYAGGVTVSVRAFGQSMTRKEAYANAFAAVLRDAGINAYASSRMD